MMSFVSKHVYAARQSVNQFSRMPLASFMTCLVIGIALALPSLLYVCLKNLESFHSHLQDTIQITLFLKSSLKSAEINKLADQLRHESTISNITIISPEEGLKELQEQMGFSGTSLPLPKNPLPWTLIVLPKTPEAMDSLIVKFKNFPQIDSLQVDQLWVKRLLSILSFAQRFFISIAIFLGLGIFLIINNVIRSATQQNQKEIEVIKLIGGTHSFIRRPFLYNGLFYGLLGGILAWQLVDIILLIIRGPLYRLAALYESSFQLVGLGFTNTLILLGSSVLLGLTASWFAVTRHLKNL